jgi:hypothetical protein
MKEDLKQRLLNDGLICLEENIGYSITYRNYKSPYAQFGYKKRVGRASIGFSKNFFIAATQFNKFIDMPITHEKFKLLSFSIENGRLLIKFDAHFFADNRSGDIELRFNVKNIDFFTRFLKK